MTATKDSSAAVQEAAIKAIGSPDQTTTNALWLIVVVGLVVVVLAAVIGLIAFAGTKNAQTSELLTVVTTALAGLVGLFVPSPAQSKKS